MKNTTKKMKVKGGNIEIIFTPDVPKQLTLVDQVYKIYNTYILPLDNIRVKGELPKLTSSQKDSVCLWINAIIRDLEMVKDEYSK